MIILRREEARKHRIRTANGSQNDTNAVKMILEAVWNKAGEVGQKNRFSSGVSRKEYGPVGTLVLAP